MAAARRGGPFLPRALIVGIRTTGETAGSADASAHELALLADAAGMTVTETVVVPLRKPNPSTLLGTGTIDTLVQKANDHEASVIVFDTDLHPRHQRNIESRSTLVITDRHAVILEIFARRATTREAKLQVELAQVEYDLPRLAGRWQHLSRQGGGSRLARGEGETQLEADRRIAMRRAVAIKRDLKLVESQRHLRRKRREFHFRASMVGYTNAGKTSLLNALTGSTAYAANQLFATLDPVSRRFSLPDGNTVIVTDTVGFVRKLPHTLVKAFHSTLEEAVESDLLLYVVDISDPQAPVQLQTAQTVVEELGVAPAESLIILNKIDRCGDLARAELMLTSTFPDHTPYIPVSAKTGEGIPELRQLLSDRAAKYGVSAASRIPG